MLKKYTIIALGALFITSQANGMSYLRRLLWGSPVAKVEKLIQEVSPTAKIDNFTQVANGVFLETIQHPLMQSKLSVWSASKEQHLELVRDIKAFYALSKSKTPLNQALVDMQNISSNIYRANSDLERELPASPKTALLYQDCEPYKSHADAYQAHARLDSLYTRAALNRTAIETAVDKIVAGEIVE